MRYAAQRHSTTLDIESPIKMALAYAGWGRLVFPLHTVIDGRCDCYKREACAHPGKHPRTLHGHKDATTDTEKIFRWWEIWPDANIGVATGIASGIVVVDIDWRNGADATLGELADRGQTFARTAQVRTPSGGFHLWYRHPGGNVRSMSNALGPGIDIKGDNGYVVAPPSIGIGGRYEWIVAMQPEAL